MSSDLKSLFTFRIVTQSGQIFMLPNRRRVAKKLLSLKRQGLSLANTTAEQKKNGQWSYDPEAYNYAARLESKKATMSPEEKAEKALTLKRLAGRLRDAAKLTNQADEISAEHMQAVKSAYDDFMAAYALANPPVVVETENDDDENDDDEKE